MNIKYRIEGDTNSKIYHVILNKNMLVTVDSRGESGREWVIHPPRIEYDLFNFFKYKC